MPLLDRLTLYPCFLEMLRRGDPRSVGHRLFLRHCLEVRHDYDQNSIDCVFDRPVGELLRNLPPFERENFYAACRDLARYRRPARPRVEQWARFQLDTTAFENALRGYFGEFERAALRFDLPGGVVSGIRELAEVIESRGQPTGHTVEFVEFDPAFRRSDIEAARLRDPDPWRLPAATIRVEWRHRHPEFIGYIGPFGHILDTPFERNQGPLNPEVVARRLAGLRAAKNK